MSDSLIELNVGGTMYTTTTSTLLSEPDSFFTLTFNINKNTFDMKKDQCISSEYGKEDGQKIKGYLDVLRLQLHVLTIYSKAKSPEILAPINCSRKLTR